MKHTAKAFIIAGTLAVFILTLIITLEAKTGFFKARKKITESSTVGIDIPKQAGRELVTATSTADIATTTAKIPLPKPKTTVSTSTKLPVKPVVSVRATSPIPTTTAAVQASPLAVSFAEINTRTRAALVNVLCTSQSGGSLEPVTGSGVIIDSRGIILTNAHVAQYYLLKDYLVNDFIECVIRTGDPATPKYKADLLYISPLWVDRNYKNITLQDPLGTGEHDFALLQITEGINRERPESFPSLTIEIDESEFMPDQEVLLAGYPAGFLGGISIQRDLYMVSSVVKINRYFTFYGNTIDLIGLGGSLLAQKGASGGAIVSNEGALLGIIVTATDAETTAERDLRAATISHIDRSLKQQNETNLRTFLSQDLAAFKEKFLSEVFPVARQKLINQIEAR